MKNKTYKTNSTLKRPASKIRSTKIKMVFMDGFKVKIYLKSFLVDMFSGSSKPTFRIVDYKVIGNKLILNNNNSLGKNIEVRNYGETLVLETDEANVVLKKIY